MSSGDHKTDYTVSILIVSYNSGHYLQNCLKSLASDDSIPQCEVIIVENGSKSPTFIYDLALPFPLRLLSSPVNIGFAKAVNAAARVSRGRYILLLNPDCEVTPGVIARCISIIDESDTPIIVGAYSLDGCGRPNSESYAPFPSWFSFARLALGIAGHNHLPEIRAPQPSSEYVVEVDAVMGFFMLVDSVFWKTLAGMDERYFLYAEDVDFCLRASRHGARRVVFRDAVVIHHGGSIPRHDTFKAKCFVESNIKYLKQHCSFVGYVCGYIFLKLWLARRKAVATLRCHNA